MTPAIRLHRLLGDELRQGEQHLLRLRGIVVGYVVVDAFHESTSWLIRRTTSATLLSAAVRSDGPCPANLASSSAPRVIASRCAVSSETPRSRTLDTISPVRSRVEDWPSRAVRYRCSSLMRQRQWSRSWARPQSDGRDPASAPQLRSRRHSLLSVCAGTLSSWRKPEGRRPAEATAPRIWDSRPSSRFLRGFWTAGA